MFKDAKEKKTEAGLAIENRIQLLQPLNIPQNIIRPKIYLSDKEMEDAKTFLTERGVDLNKPLFMISVLGSDMSKTYPFAYMAQVIDTLAETSQGQILFNYIPNQEADAKAIYDQCKPETQNQILFDVFGKSLRDFLAITTQCDALIGNEGGAVNMAKALGIPTFTIFSPWIIKDAWNMFDDGKKHVSVHLNDYKPELFEKASGKAIKSKSADLYLAFTPDAFMPQLKDFLENL